VQGEQGRIRGAALAPLDLAYVGPAGKANAVRSWGTANSRRSPSGMLPTF